MRLSRAAGIDAENLGSIFEEHVVVNSLDPFNPVNNSFGLREKLFNFGTVMAQLQDAAVASADTGKGKAKGSGKPAAEPAPAAGAAKGGASKLDAAASANLKFVNPIKVPCTVNFRIKPSSNHPAGEEVLGRSGLTPHLMQMC
jgi:hydrocephalus-inducing protein